MKIVYIVLIFAFIISIILSLYTLTAQRNKLEIINDMGIGWNMGNTFDCYIVNKTINNPDEQITLWGNILPTKNLFVKLKKYGFKTIRFPITWLHFMNEEGIINKIWILRIKEVVDWIIDLNMYCIINTQYDGSYPNWLSKGEESKDKFILLWQQISEEFKDYDDHLIFECLNDIQYDEDNYNYTLLYIFNQECINVIRNSKKYNKERLLILSGANRDLYLTCSPDYKLPIDPYNKYAISIHYYLPSHFAMEPDSNPWIYIYEGNEIIIKPLTVWGNDNDYKEMITHFETLKKTYLDNGIPIIITETGVLTEEKKELESIRKYLFAVFSMSGSYNGIMSCLWDNSVKNKGEMNYFNRINNQFFDEKIGENFKKISKGKYVKPTDYIIFTNNDITYTVNSDGYLEIKFGTKKVSKIIFNIKILTDHLNNIIFGIVSSDKNGQWFAVEIPGKKGIRQYDGSYTFIIDSGEKDYNNYIQIQKWLGNANIIFNYLSLEFDKKYKILDFNAYIAAL